MHHTAEHRSAAMNDCIDNCTQCHQICIETASYCLSMGGKHASADHIGLLQTCADICATSAAAMLRGAAAHPAICGACAEACTACATACKQFGDDETMKRCAEICRRCEKSCRAMAGMAGMTM